jgi:transcriptional regulator GlxA family with amidase domain
VPIRLRPSGVERELLKQFAAQFTGVGTGHSEAILHTALALLHLILIGPEIRWQGQEVPEGVRRALRTIETDYARPLHLTDLARTAGLCAGRFSRVFTRWRGVTPSRFLSQVRVREAANLLASTDQSLDEIAERAGFPDRYYMSRVFKRVLGDSPAHFRRRHALRPR